MSVPAIKQAAARSAARAKKRKETSPPPPAPPSPEGVIKTSSNGTPYRVYTVSLADLPRFLQSKKLEQFILYKNGENRYMSSDLSTFAASLAYMREVFRLAIPEIEEGAEIVFVHSNPFRPAVTALEGSLEHGEPIELRKYDIPGPYPTYFSFTITYLPEANRVLVLRIPIEELPADMPQGGEYYIIQYVQKKKTDERET